MENLGILRDIFQPQALTKDRWFDPTQATKNWLDQGQKILTRTHRYFKAQFILGYLISALIGNGDNPTHARNYHDSLTCHFTNKTLICTPNLFTIFPCYSLSVFIPTLGFPPLSLPPLINLSFLILKTPFHDKKKVPSKVMWSTVLLYFHSPSSSFLILPTKSIVSVCVCAQGRLALPLAKLNSLSLYRHTQKSLLLCHATKASVIGPKTHTKFIEYSIPKLIDECQLPSLQISLNITFFCLHVPSK